MHVLRPPPSPPQTTKLSPSCLVCVSPYRTVVVNPPMYLPSAWLLPHPSAISKPNSLNSASCVPFSPPTQAGSHTFLSQLHPHACKILRARDRATFSNSTIYFANIAVRKTASTSIDTRCFRPLILTALLTHSVTHASCVWRTNICISLLLPNIPPSMVRTLGPLLWDQWRHRFRLVSQHPSTLHSNAVP